MAAPSAWEETSPALRAVFESAARLQELVPDAVLVGGSAGRRRHCTPRTATRMIMTMS